MRLTKEQFMEVTDITIYPSCKKSFIEQYFMRDEAGREIQAYSVWRNGSLTLHDVPVSELVLEKMGESFLFDRTEVFNSEDFPAFEPEMQSCWDQCDFGFDVINNKEVDGVDVEDYMEEVQSNFYEDEELQEEYWDMFNYLEEGLGFEVEEYSILIYNGYEIEVDEYAERNTEE